MKKHITYAYISSIKGTFLHTFKKEKGKEKKIKINFLILVYKKKSYNFYKIFVLIYAKIIFFLIKSKEEVFPYIKEKEYMIEIFEN